MTLRSLLSAVVVSGLPVLEGVEFPTASPVDTETPAWLAFDFSPDQLEADYQRTLNAGRSAEAEARERRLGRAALRSAAMIPVLFQADAAQDDEPAPRDEVPPVVEDLPAEGEEPAAKLAESVLPLDEDAVLEERMRELQRENEELRARLSQWEAMREPVEPFIDPDWPAQPEPRRRFTFRRSPVLPPSLESPRRPSIVAVSREVPRFRPFTRAAMDTPRLGWTPPERARSLKEQRRFFRNADQARGAGVRSEEYRGVRLEVEKAMLRGELNPRYAAQYLADIVEIFRTYERLKRFGLTGPVPPPVNADSFRQDPDLMFTWASEVNEQKRRMDVE